MLRIHPHPAVHGNDQTVPLTVPYARGVQQWYNTMRNMEILLKGDFLGW
jgi:hypothetical protein